MLKWGYGQVSWKYGAKRGQDWKGSLDAYPLNKTKDDLSPFCRFSSTHPIPTRGGGAGKNKDKVKTFGWRVKEENTGNYLLYDTFGQVATCQLTWI